MASVKQCDACGRVYIRNSAFCAVNDGGFISGIQTINRAGRKDETFDLCDCCIGRLINWLSHTNEESVSVTNLCQVKLEAMPNRSKPIDDGGWEAHQKGED